jgi:hypothetical protein
VRTPAKNASTFEINIFYYFCLWAPLLFLTQSKETVSWCCFYNKNKILPILFLVKYDKNHTFWSVFSVVGAHKLHVQMRKRNKIKTLKHTHSSLISMTSTLSIMAVLLCWLSFMLSVSNNRPMAECRYSECHHAECRYA